MTAQQLTPIIEQSAIAVSRPWSIQDYPEIAAWVQANVKPLAILTEGVKRPHYYNPLIPGDGTLFGALLPTPQKCRQLASLLSTRAMLRLNQGNIEGAWADVMTCHRLGRHVSHGGCDIENLIGIAIDSIAVRATHHLAQSDFVTSEQLRTALVDLQQLPPLEPMHRIMNLGERCITLDLVQGMHRGIITIQTLGLDRAEETTMRDIRNFDLVAVMRLLNQWTDQAVELAQSARGPGRHFDYKAIQEKYREITTPDFSNSTALGRAFLSPEEQSIEFAAWVFHFVRGMAPKLFVASERAEQTSDLEQITLMLAIYHKAHHHFPQSLQQLPNVDEQLLIDHFTGKPLIYDRVGEGYKLLSVGPNGQEDFESDPQPYSPNDDIEMFVPIPIKTE